MDQRILVAIDGNEIPLKLDGAYLAIDVEEGPLGHDRYLRFGFLPDGTIEIEILESQNGDFESIKTLRMLTSQFANYLLGHTEHDAKPIHRNN